MYCIDTPGVPESGDAGTFHCLYGHIWLGHTYGRPLRSSRPLKTWYHFSKGLKQLWVLKTEAALAPWLHIRLSRKSERLLFVIRASDVVLPIFDILSTFCATRGHWVLGGGSPCTPQIYKTIQNIKNQEDHVTSPNNEDKACKSWWKWMNSLAVRAASVN